jgi:hypothetical protein
VTQTLYAHMNKRKDKRLSTNQEGKAWENDKWREGMGGAEL